MRSMLVALAVLFVVTVAGAQAPGGYTPEQVAPAPGAYAPQPQAQPSNISAASVAPRPLSDTENALAAGKPAPATPLTVPPKPYVSRTDLEGLPARVAQLEAKKAMVKKQYFSAVVHKHYDVAESYRLQLNDLESQLAGLVSQYRLTQKYLHDQGGYPAELQTFGFLTREQADNLYAPKPAVALPPTDPAGPNQPAPGTPDPAAPPTQTGPAAPPAPTGPTITTPPTAPPLNTTAPAPPAEGNNTMAVLPIIFLGGLLAASIVFGVLFLTRNNARVNVETIDAVLGDGGTRAAGERATLVTGPGGRLKVIVEPANATP